MTRDRLGLYGAHLALCVLLLFESSGARAQPSSSFIPGGGSKGPVQIEAEKLNYYSKESKAVYAGHVMAKQGEASLQAETLTIFLLQEAETKSPHPLSAPSGLLPSTSSNQVRRMEAEGSVIVTQKDQVGTGDRGWYERSENKVYLVGNVTLLQGPNVAKGEKLVYDLTTGQAQIIGRVSTLLTPKPQNSKDNPK